MNVRPASDADAERCAEIYAPFVLNTWVSFEEAPPDKEEMIRRIHASHFWLIAEDDGGSIAGFGYATRHRERAAYALSADVSVYVDPQYSRKGYGRALYGKLLAEMKREGFHAAFAGIALPNAASVGLHEAMGFRPVGIFREVGWKLNGWRDVGWWQRLL